MGNFIGLNEIKKASQILQTVVIESPFQKIESYSQKYNSNIFFKREDLQKVRCLFADARSDGNVYESVSS